MSLGWNRFLQGSVAEGIEAMKKSVALSGGAAFPTGMLACVYGLAGMPELARELIAELHGRARTSYVMPPALVAAYIGLGEIDQALDWVERSVEEGFWYYVLPPKIVPFERLRPHPRFQAALKKMNLTLRTICAS